MSTPLPFPWNTVHRLQLVTDSITVNAQANGRDEALTTIVEELADGEVPPDEETMERRYRTLAANRAKKYRYHGMVDGQLAHQLHPEPFVQSHFETVALREIVGLVSSHISPDEKRLLQELSDGDSYGQLASRYGIKIGTLKSRVSRLRSNVRNSSVARIVHEALDVSTSHPTGEQTRIHP